ncbi:fatty acid desaturase [Nitrobacteraceae bacterium AZCC 1564]
MEVNTVTIEPGSDYSKSFQKLRPLILNRTGVRYVDFIKTLKPRYSRLFLDIGFGYAALITTCVLVVAFTPAGIIPGLMAATLGALSIGFWIAYLQLFIHEGAHFNFNANRGRSDLLCNLLIAWMIGTSVQKYRIVHFQHHRALGSVDDSEITYFFPLNLLFIVKGLLGIRVLEVLASRNKLQAKKEAVRDDSGKYVGLAGLAAHVVILAVTYVFGSIWLTLAWVAGVGAIFPFFGALRQLLEHRDERAAAGTNYFEKDHGAYTRIFGNDVFSSIFGGAGFNRHLLHHWEPSLSYTNLAELEAYLLDTDIARLIDMRRSSYFKTFASLFRFK